jgi:hypothetical protein
MEILPQTNNCQINLSNRSKRSGKRRFRITGFGLVSFAIQLIVSLVIILPNIMIFRYTGWAYITIKTNKDKFSHTYLVKNAQDFIDRLEDVKKAEEKIIFFEYVGQGSEGSPNLKGWGLSIGYGGIYSRLLIPEAKGVPPYVFMLEDKESLIREVFDAKATIELEACFTAFNDKSIAYAFKKILPKAYVWGYTGKAYPLPITGVHESFHSRGSEWIAINHITTMAEITKSDG